MTAYVKWIVFCCMLLAAQLLSAKKAEADAGAEDAGEEVKVITSGDCDAFAIEDVPVGDFRGPVVFPEQPFNIEQGYNNPKDDGYKYKGVWYYGHDGLDGDGASEKKGVNDVMLTQDGLVVVSRSWKNSGGWGELIITATRADTYSEEILTFHHGHMHSTGNDKNYETTRRFNACEWVARGEVIGKEGSTGHSTGSHLHFGIRRWDNLAALQDAITTGGIPLYGHGYVFDNSALLAGNLNPYGYLFDTFSDYQVPAGEPEPPYIWSLPYVLEMRHSGFEFGIWDGGYGAQQPVTREEAARWIKIAAERQSVFPSVPSFCDVDADDPGFPYVEALVRYPEENPVINIDNNCEDGDVANHFCPDREVTRAEALKMIITGFYGKEFLKVYNDYIWRAGYASALALLQKLQDVSPFDWYATYVYFGAYIGLVAFNENFYPEAPVMREEMAKWIIGGYNHLRHQASYGYCLHTSCPLGYVCDPASGDCYPQPVCVPTETTQCDIGGGYDPCSGNPVCTPGQAMAQECGYGGTQTAICDDSCKWGDWGSCSGGGSCAPGEVQSCGNCGQSVCQSDYQWGPCNDQGVCAPGTTQSQSCNQSGTQSRTCLNTCTWGAWGQCTTQCECSSGTCCDGCNYYDSSYICDGYNIYRCQGTSPGQDAQKAVINTHCSGYGANCDGAETQSNWQLYEDCSTSQVCEMDGGISGCVPYSTCTDQYIAGTTSACYTSPGTQYGYKVCLEVQQVSGASWKYRVCNNGGTFTYGIKYKLLDENHLSQDMGGEYQEGGGKTCSSWRNFSVSHITQYGAVNGAGLRAEVVTPPTCTLSSCKYKTGLLTIRKECL